MKINEKIVVGHALALPKQIIRVMKLTILLTTACLMQVSALTKAQVYLSTKGESLQKVLKTVSKQSGYDFVYVTAELKGLKTGAISLKNASIEESLKACLSNQPLVYEISDKTVMVRLKDETSFVDRIIDRLQAIDVKGRVLGENNQPLAGATISVKGGKTTTTNNNGEFMLLGVDENAKISISFLGYATREFSVKMNLGDILLELSDSKLNEVQVIGYGEVEKQFSTTNVGTIKASQISKQPVSNPLLALQGRVPGLFIQQTSGVNGAGVNVTVQGKNSLLNGNDPFYVIDGVPYSPQFSSTLMSGAVGSTNGNTLNFINPADIESVSILKDADATAIYGSRAANGAILITTKKGKAGKTKVNLNMQSGWGKATRLLKLMNTQQYLEMRKESYVNAGFPVPSANNPATPPDPSNYDLTIWDQNKYTDWQKELVGGTAGYTDIQASISGGNVGTRFLAGYGYHRETTVYPGDLSDVKGNFHFNVDHNSTDNKFKWMVSGSFMQDKNKLNAQDLMTSAIILAPNRPDLRNPDGTLNFAYLPGTTNSTIFGNPLSYTEERFTGNTSNLIGNNVLSYEVLPGLSLKTSMGYNRLQSDETKFRPQSYFDPNIPQQFQTRTGSFLNKSITTWNIEPQATYNKETMFGVFDAIIGSTFQEIKTDVLRQTGKGYSTDASIGNLQAATTRTIDIVFKPTYKYTAVFGRLNYRLMDKYVINLVARRDGSSRFGDENKFNNFYSVGGAWLFSNEEVIKQKLSWLSFGKLKASYGTTGNDQFDDYRYLSLLSNYTAAQIPYQQTASLYPTNIANPLLQWEETRKLNVGVDLGFLNNKFLLNVNYFRNRSSNQLIAYPLPLITGFGSVYSNFPAVVQNTGWEMELNVSVIKNKSFNWSSSANLTIPRNKLAEFPDLGNSSFAKTNIIGKPFNITRLYQLAEVNPTTGLYEFINAKGERTSAPNFANDRVALLDLNPKYYGGWSNTFSYKGVELDFLFQFVKQLGRNYYYGNSAGFIDSNQPLSILNRWKKPGDVTDIQKVSQGDEIYDPMDAVGSSSGGISDASFIRLKNVSLSYSLPATLIKRAGMSDARIYTQAQNLWTITKFKGTDPESQTATLLPPLRMITLGLQITF